jgi:phosphodiesterase/alkaline phosphatase D-like protein
MSIRRLLRIGMTFSVLGSGLFFLSTPVLAAQTYGGSLSFGSAGSGAGQFELQPGSLDGYGARSGSSVAVNDTTHDVYVTDTGNARIDEFDQSGSFIRAWGYGVADGATNALQTCTTTCFAGIPGSGEGQLALPVAIAVDNSGGSSNEDVYVAEAGNDRIEKFDSTGAYLATIPLPERIGGKGLMGVAVDTNGNVWLVEQWPGGYMIVDEFDSAGVMIASWVDPNRSGSHPGLAVDLAEDVYADVGPFIGPLGGNVTKYNSLGEYLSFVSGCCSDGLAFDKSTGDLFADYETSVVQSDSSGNVVREFGFGSLGAGQGIAVDSASGTVYVADSVNNAIEVFPLVTLPDVGVGAPSNVQRTSVTLNGSVAPVGIDASGFQVEYGLTSGYGASVALSPSSCSALETECPVTVVLTGLKLDTTYHYRLDASNVNGTNNGQDVTFRTASAVTGVSSGSPSSLTATSATITGSLEPEGIETHYYCQYGLSASYGLVSPALPGVETSAPNGSVPATCALSGLQPHKTYHYRLVATNSYGTTLGEDVAFVTPSAPPSVDRQLATVVTQTRAAMTALINANNEDTTYHFEYGLTTEYGTTLASVDIGSGYGDLNVGSSATGLLPGHTYHFRLVASNATGTTYGADQTFVTPPAALPLVGVLPASVSPNGVSLSGTVDAQGVQSFYEFDLGPDTGYGTRVFGNAGFGSGPVNVTVSLQNLAAGTTYHYRLVASNVYGATYGPDETFMTPAYPTAVLSAPLTAVLVAVPMAVFPPSERVASGRKAKQATKTRLKRKAKKKKKKGKGGKARRAGHRHAGMGRGK